MYSVEECRKRAQECVELAQSVRETEKAMLLKLAQNWHTLADEQAKLERLVKTDIRPATQNSAVTR